jgi:hypothetical protein
MQLDETRVAIRERTFADICDLAFQVIRGHAVGIFTAVALGVLPLAILNDVLINQNILGAVNWEPGSYQSEAEASTQAFMGYLFWQALIFVEAPLATAPLTLYLSRILFVAKPSTREIFSTFLGCLHQLFLFQVLLRGILAVFCLIPVVFTYWIAPFLNEIILLERGKVGQVYRRSSDLHRGMGSLIIGRWAASLGFGVVLFFALWFGFLALRDLFIVQADFENPGEIMGLRFFLPAALWLVVALFAVIRFLSYLDLRIRREGWEIELRMRAEGARLSQRVT